MKILVFEYITGGGFAQEDLPESLATEGLLMLETLIGELSVLASIELTVLLDFRINSSKFPENIKVVKVKKGQCIYELLPSLIESIDWVWPIAPEINSELEKISALVNQKKKGLLNSSLKAVTLCSDKFLTYHCLKSQGIAVVETNELSSGFPEFPGKWVIKPKEGAGCIDTFFVEERVLFEKLKSQVDKKTDYIYQTYMKGESLSLSCLFRDGIGWLLCCNRQKILNYQGRFKLMACEVNIVTENLTLYQDLVEQVAGAIPGLWGYVGIDIIQPETGQPMILEINPRLTTSYAGIYQAIGMNVAETVLGLIEKKPQVSKTKNKTIMVSI